jgi:hypothetical protein
MFAYFRNRRIQRDEREKARGRQFAADTVNIEGEEEGIKYLEDMIECSAAFNDLNTFDDGIIEYLGSYQS